MKQWKVDVKDNVHVRKRNLVKMIQFDMIISFSSLVISNFLLLSPPFSYFLLLFPTFSYFSYFLLLSPTFSSFLLLSPTFSSFLLLSLTFSYFLLLSPTFSYFLLLSPTFSYFFLLSPTFSYFLLKWSEVDNVIYNRLTVYFCFLEASFLLWFLHTEVLDKYVGIFVKYEIY